ncbi:hypothetical protein DWB63_14435, partial [Pseudodesulfovibrio sp. S3]
DTRDLRTTDRRQRPRGISGSPTTAPPTAHAQTSRQAYAPALDRKGLEADRERAAAPVRRTGVSLQWILSGRGSAVAFDGLEPPRADQLLAADHRAAKLGQGPFLVLFWASKKEPRREGMEAEGAKPPHWLSRQSRACHAR